MGKRTRGAAEQPQNTRDTAKRAEKARRKDEQQKATTFAPQSAATHAGVGFTARAAAVPSHFADAKLQTRSPVILAGTGTDHTSSSSTRAAGLPVKDDWAPLADRLNPTRKAFDPLLKEQWASMSKKQRKKLQKQDRQTIAAMKARGRSIQHTFTPDPNDHCETSPIAYRHIAPILQLVAAVLNKSPKSLRIWDPYYCAGSVQRHLRAVGFPLVYNVNEDFYKVVASGQLPEHDVLLTNPPYTGDHVERFIRFAVENGKPWFLLVPDYFANRPNYPQALGPVRPFYLCPRERYHYWTPDGLREERNVKGHRNLALGRRNSPFVSYWHIHLSGALGREGLLSKQPSEIGLEEGVRLFETAGDVTAARWGTSVSRVDDE